MTPRPQDAPADWLSNHVVGEHAVDPGSIAHIVKRRSAAAGYDPDLLGGHSLKRDAKNTAKDRRVHPAQLKQLGGTPTTPTIGAYLEQATCSRITPSISYLSHASLRPACRGLTWTGAIRNRMLARNAWWSKWDRVAECTRLNLFLLGDAPRRWEHRLWYARAVAMAVSCRYPGARARAPGGHVKIITWMNEKGGTGKTTLACHAAWFFADAGKRVLVVDLDRQANATSTLSEHNQAIPALQLFQPGSLITDGKDPITLSPATPDLLDVELSRDTPPLLAFRDNLAGAPFDVCVIDTPPQIGMRTVAALLASDAVIAPVELGDYSLQGVQRLLDAIDGIDEAFGRRPDFLGLLVSKFDRRSVRERALFDQLAEQLPNLLFPLTVTKRDAYGRAAGWRGPVWQMPGTACREAAAEIRGVLSEIANRMQIDLA